jgi:hypothetical protein
MLSKKFIIAGAILSIGVIALNAHLVLGADFPMSLFGLTLPFGERGFVMLLGVGLIGLRWFFVHGNPSDNDQS